ncbi:6-phosphogluconate dehydrogenase-like protein [Rhodococcus sp. SMB37]|uniref:NAD(P)-binding domain-containing protein n=1 Tax=Rhodococcus sp. SMB37 TaxID=2512213 RepID=UPI00104815F3|nr:NAD(P)-binding domain-containing protein [Rhodococcus sp. SMB37]TCN53395.1 6-phosphogluconate dehydrogenase-like protein [Rhodococcus sp. SMB37]
MPPLDTTDETASAQTPRVAVPGTGLMASAIARALLNRDNPASVRNRTASRCEPLRGRAARRCDTATVRDNDLILMLPDDATTRALPAYVADVLRGKAIVNPPSGSAAEASNLGAWVSERGASYLDGILASNPDEIGQQSTLSYYAGSARNWTQCNLHLQFLSAATYVGPAPSAANALDAAMTATFHTVSLGAWRRVLMPSRPFPGGMSCARSVGLDLNEIQRALSYRLDLLPQEIDAALNNVQAGSHTTDQATLDTYLVALRTINSAMISDGERGRATTRVILLYGKQAPMAVPTELVLTSRPDGISFCADFTTVQVQPPSLGPGQVEIENLHSSVDPYMRGRMTGENSYVTGFRLGETISVKAVGRVTASKTLTLSVGDLLIHDFGWRTHLSVDACGCQLATDPPDVHASAYLGALGMPSFTTYVGLIDIAALRSGDIVLDRDASGAAGRAVGEFAKLSGSQHVIGSVGSATKAATLKVEYGFDETFNYHDRPLPDLLRTAAPNGLDFYIGNVGGDHLQPRSKRCVPAARSRCVTQSSSTTARYRQSSMTSAPQLTAESRCADLFSTIMNTSVSISNSRLVSGLPIDSYSAQKQYSTRSKNCSPFSSETKWGKVVIKTSWATAAMQFSIPIPST